MVGFSSPGAYAEYIKVEERFCWSLNGVAEQTGSVQEALELGALVELATPHCDPTVNLHDYYHCVRGEELVHIWPIAGRGVL